VLFETLKMAHTVDRRNHFQGGNDMVKGIHKKIIEVHQPDSAYFEKAIFYLRPGITQLPPELAHAAAQEYLREMEPLTRVPFWKRVLPMLCSAVLSAAAACIVCLLVL
jgi:hypothetical protein